MMTERWATALHRDKPSNYLGTSLQSFLSFTHSAALMNAADAVTKFFQQTLVLVLKESKRTLIIA
jgi:hypothetical protein